MATLKERIHRYNGSSYDTVHYETSADLVLYNNYYKPYPSQTILRTTSSSGLTGYLKISTPLTLGATTDANFTIFIQRYSTLGTANYNISLNCSSTATAVSGIKVYSTGTTLQNYTVRADVDSNNNVFITIGESDTLWKYLSVYITDVRSATKDLTNLNNWTVSVDSSITFSSEVKSVTSPNTGGIRDATTSLNGLMTAADKTKLDGIDTGANAYTHPTSAGNKHIPSGGSAGQFLGYGSASGTAAWSALPSASSSTAGITTVGASGGAAAYSHTHAPTDLSSAVTVAKGGTGATTGAGAIYNLTNPATALTSSGLASGDYLPILDTSASTGKKVTIENLTAYLKATGEVGGKTYTDLFTNLGTVDTSASISENNMTIVTFTVPDNCNMVMGQAQVVSNNAYINIIILIDVNIIFTRMIGSSSTLTNNAHGVFSIMPYTHTNTNYYYYDISYTNKTYTFSLGKNGTNINLTYYQL